MRSLLLWITKKLMAWCEKKGRVIKITGTAGPDDVYLIRHLVIRSRFFNFYIHQFLRSDRDDLHDHPWNFCTLLLRGAYTEQFKDRTSDAIISVRRTTSLNKLVFRRATDLHRVVVDRDLKEKDKEQSALTLFFSGPKKREWGFVKDGEWQKWTKYLGLPDDTPSRG